ncbi:MAG: hypothetical protein ABI035_09385 [Gemmatimonadaceae bacterium]
MPSGKLAVPDAVPDDQIGIDADAEELSPGAECRVFAAGMREIAV